ncbi:heavy metal-binding protein HIP-like [Saccostrea cucullata]|uniref:heavy metal-binding protein HIP-like n=1 Tax=Saccostrea cuccullata TaxID=36930 RepID=UPI002ED5EFC3
MRSPMIIVYIVTIQVVFGNKSFLQYLKNQANNLEKGLHSVIKGGEYSNNDHVAFSAYQSKAKSYKLHETWIHDKVLLNEGNAYNKVTGTFIAPSGGTYACTWCTLTDPWKTAHPYLRVNGHYKGFTAFNNSHTSQSVWSSGSNTIFVRLKKGDRVDIASGYLAAYARENWTSFSGWKIY